MPNYIADYLNNLPNGAEKTEVTNALMKAVLTALSEDPINFPGTRQFLVGGMADVYNFIKLIAANNGSSPTLATFSSIDADVDLTVALQGKAGVVIGNGLGQFLEARTTGNGASRRIIFEMSDTGVTVRTSTGDLTIGSPVMSSQTVSLSGHVRTTGRRSEAYSAQNPTSGSTIVTSTATRRLLIINGGITIAALTAVLPPNPIDGELFSLGSDCTVTALTLNSGAGGATLWGAPSTISNSTPVCWTYVSASNKWVRTL